jgi:Tat protein secretion system quality control protein TatD with DNase activity
VAEAVAAIKEIPVDEVVAKTTANFRRLYGTENQTWETLAA